MGSIVLELKNDDEVMLPVDEQISFQDKHIQYLPVVD